MRNTAWILLDTETTGLAAPIFVVELAAQRMRGSLPNQLSSKISKNHCLSDNHLRRILPNAP